VSWGELLFDLFPDGPRLGGAAANVAFHAHALGATALLVSRVGDDALGRRARAALEADGVDVRFVGVDAERPTGTVRVELDDGEPRFTIGEEAAWDRVALVPELGAELARADAFVFGTLAQRTPLGSQALAAALDMLPPACLRIADLNVRPPHVTAPALELALAHASVVKLNELEARRVAEVLAVDDPVAGLFARGVSIVALTRGARGATLHTRGNTSEHAGFAARPGGDSVGAGDAFAATLAVELVRATRPGAALERANRYAAFVAGQRGAMPRPPPELLAELHAMA
jgi:fructokinase